jgi:hypothetical protein
MNKHAALAELVALRRSEENENHSVLHRFDNGAWDFDHVVPWTKSACNVDAKLMIIGQDWASEKSLLDPKHNSPEQVALRKQLGQDPHLPTNKNIKRWLTFFDLAWEQAYATDVSVFIKRGAITAKVPMAVLKRCAETYTIPQLDIVKPLMAICLGGDTFNSLRSALGKTSMLLREALKPDAHTTLNGTEICGVPHAGGLGLASYGGFAKVDPMWQALADRFKQLNA